MGLTKFPKGVSSFGMPQLGAGGHFTTGDVYFVDSGATGASDGNLGDSPDRPLATLNGAMNRVTANNGDMVFLMPGHAENVSSATTQVIDVAGVSIIGIGNGTLKPTFTYTATAGSFEIDAANTLIENVRFLSSISAVVVGVNVDANDVTLRGCQFDFDETGDDFLIMIDVDTVDRCVIEGCDFLAEDTAGAAKAIRLDDCDDCKIVGNYFHGDFSSAAILGDTTGDTGDNLPVNLVISDNTVYNSDTVQASNGIDINVAATGVIAYNRIGSLYPTAIAAVLDPGSCLCIENYVVNAIDETGGLVPQTVSSS